MTAKDRIREAFLILLLLFPIVAYPAEIETHYYLEIIDSKTAKVEWKYKNGAVPILTWLGEDETITTWNNTSLATVKWLISNPKQNTYITAQRNNNQLTLNGILKGKPVERKVIIDDSPWCQVISLSLRLFIVSNDFKYVFWNFHPDTLKVYKLRALKTSVDILTINGQAVKAQKVKISLAGILSVLGESYYWFKKDDGVFIKYEGPGLKPEDKITVILK